MKIEKIRINPKLAKELLEANTKNRPKKEGKITEYANDMKNNQWIEETGEMIKISKSGYVLDGQNRLYAIIKSGVTLNFHIAKDLEEDVFRVLDSGAMRSCSDMYFIEGVKYYNTIPSIIAKYYVLLQGKSADRSSQKASHSKSYSIYEDRKQFWNNVAAESYVYYNKFSKIMSCKLIGSFFALFSDIDEVKAYNFFEELTTGNNISNDTIKALRQKLLQDKLSTKKIKATIKEAYIIKAWNCYVQFKVVSKLVFNPETEDYPKIIGLSNIVK